MHFLKNVVNPSQLFEGELPHRRQYCLDVADESAVQNAFAQIRKNEGRLDVRNSH